MTYENETKIIVAIIVTAIITMLLTAIGTLVIKETFDYSVKIKEIETRISELCAEEESLIQSAIVLRSSIDELSFEKQKLFSKIATQTNEQLLDAKRLAEEIEKLTIIRDALKEDIINLFLEEDIELNLSISM